MLKIFVFTVLIILPFSIVHAGVLSKNEVPDPTTIPFKQEGNTLSAKMQVIHGEVLTISSDSFTLGVKEYAVKGEKKKNKYKKEFTQSTKTYTIYTKGTQLAFISGKRVVIKKGDEVLVQGIVDKANVTAKFISIIPRFKK
jgi:hypothetical protein